MTNTIKLPTIFTLKVDNLLQDVYSRKYKREVFFYFLQTLTRQSKFHPVEELQNSRARLKAEYLRKEICFNINDYIKILLDKQIIQCDNQFIVGSKSYDYWITDNFMEITTIEDLVLQTEIIINDSYLFDKIKNSKSKTIDKKHKELLGFLNALDFDSEKAYKWLFDLNTSGYFNTPTGLNTNKISSYLNMIQSIVNRDWFIVEDEKTGRIFHNFNLIKRELRSFFTYQGKKLVQSDLKSSQPYFLASHLLKLLPGNENIQKFFKVVTENDIYNYMADVYSKLNPSGVYTNYKGEVLSLKTRQDFKVGFLTVLFKPNKGQAELEKVFKLEFPEVLNQIRLVKKDFHNTLSLQLQTNESNIFISAHNKLKKVFLNLPVHDSLYVPEDRETEMLDELKRQFKNKGYKNYTLTK